MLYLVTYNLLTCNICFVFYYSGKVFIGGLSFATSESTVRQFFEKYGQVNSVEIMMDKFTGRSRGFGFLEFESDTSIVNMLADYKRDPGVFMLDSRSIVPRRAVTKEAMRDVTSNKYRTSKLFVGGIGNSSEAELRDYFSQYAAVQQIDLITDKLTNVSRGFGFIQFASDDDVDNLIALQREKPFTLAGKQLEVKKAQPKSERPPPRDDRYGGRPPYDSRGTAYDRGYGGGDRDRYGGGGRYDDRRGGGYDSYGGGRGGRYDDRGYDDRRVGYDSRPPYNGRSAGYDRGEPRSESRGYEPRGPLPPHASSRYRSPSPYDSRAPRY